MGQLINDIIKGFIFLAFAAGSYGMVKGMASEAADVHKVGLMSYTAYTKMLTEKK